MERKILSDALKPGPDCLSIEYIGHYADGALPAAERVVASAHIEACANCQAELALLRAFAATTVRDDEAESVRAGVAALRRRESDILGSGRREASSLGQWGSVWLFRHAISLAAVLLLVVGGFYLLNPAPPRLPTNVSSGDEVTRSLTVAVRAPIGEQVDAPARLEWQPVTGAVRYRVRLMEVDRHELWSTDVAATSVDLPQDVRARIVPAKTLLWQVTAYGASNAPLAESDVARFRLTPK